MKFFTRLDAAFTKACLFILLLCGLLLAGGLLEQLVPVAFHLLIAGLVIAGIWYVYVMAWTRKRQLDWLSLGAAAFGTVIVLLVGWQWNWVAHTLAPLFSALTGASTDAAVSAHPAVASNAQPVVVQTEAASTQGMVIVQADQAPDRFTLFLWLSGGLALMVTVLGLALRRFQPRKQVKAATLAVTETGTPPPCPKCGKVKPLQSYRYTSGSRSVKKTLCEQCASMLHAQPIS